MKIGILVQSPLLERTLQLYLREYLANTQDCDFVITDKVDESLMKPICLISFSEDSDILRPIYKESLMSDLARFNAKFREMQSALGANMKAHNVLDFSEMERLRQSLDLINGLESNSSSLTEHQSLADEVPKKDIRDKIEIMVEEYRKHLYDLYGTIKNG